MVKEGNNYYLTKEACEAEAQQEMSLVENSNMTYSIETKMLEPPSVYAVAKTVYIKLLKDALISTAIVDQPGTLAAIREIEEKEGVKGWMKPGRECWMDRYFSAAAKRLSRQKVRDETCRALGVIGLSVSEGVQAADMVMSLLSKEEAKETICQEPVEYCRIRDSIISDEEDMCDC